jgi:hypothetical protein
MRPGTGLNSAAYVQETHAAGESYRVVWRNLAEIERVIAGMTSPILKRFFEMCCRHNFSWPHTGVFGKAYQSYQVCLICGAVYAYDCSTMTRTGRLVAPMDNYPDNAKDLSSRNDLATG